MVTAARRGMIQAMTTESLFVHCRSCGAVMLGASAGGRPRIYCGSRDCNIARQRDRRTKMLSVRAEPVRTTQGNNAEMVANAARLYIPDGAIVADVTYGKGAFWTRANRKRFSLIGSDLEPSFGGASVAADCRSLPYRNHSVGVVVLDPPYIAYPGQHLTDHRYNNAATTPRLYHDGIIQLYAGAMAEACRVLTAGGFLWVKCKDEVSHDRQNWSHIQIYEHAIQLGLHARDLFVVVAANPATAMGTWKRQLHARKTHSFMWIFEKRRT
jgi:hypothetical protein